MNKEFNNLIENYLPQGSNLAYWHECIFDAYSNFITEAILKKG
jgi:hypothetical protein